MEEEVHNYDEDEDLEVEDIYNDEPYAYGGE